MHAHHNARSQRVGEQVAPAEFTVGQDRHGLWLAVAASGRNGGMFITKDAALRYALAECGRKPGAIRFSNRRIALKI